MSTFYTKNCLCLIQIAISLKPSVRFATFLAQFIYFALNILEMRLWNRLVSTRVRDGPIFPSNLVVGGPFFSGEKCAKHPPSGCHKKLHFFALYGTYSTVQTCEHDVNTTKSVMVTMVTSLLRHCYVIVTSVLNCNVYLHIYRHAVSRKK